MQRDYGYFEEGKLGRPYDLRLFRRLFPFIRPQRHLFFFSVVLVSVVTVLDLALPYLTKVAIDRYIVQDVFEGKKGAKEGLFRAYRVDLSAPENREIIGRYPGLFHVKDRQATIRYEDLSELRAFDLAVLRRDDLSGVEGLAFVFLGLVVCHFFVSFGNVVVLERAGQSIMHDLRLKLFRHIQDLSVNFFSKNPVGRLVTRVTSDVQNMHEFFTSIITVLFKDVFLLAGITVVLVAMNWRLALVCFLMLPLVFLTTSYFSRLARDVFRELRIKIAQINSKIQESIDGIRVIQLFCKEGTNLQRFERLNHENYQVGMRQINIFAVFMPAIEVLSSVTTALVVWYGGMRVLDDTLSLGVLVAFIAYMKMFFRPIRDIAEKYNVMQSAMASCERIFLLFDTEDRIPELEDRRGIAQDVHAPQDGTTAVGQDEGGKRDVLSFRALWFAYEGEDWVLKNLSFSVRQGETVAIVGPTGAGKSTIINLLERFYDPGKGSIEVGGIDIRTVPKAALRKRMALIPQDVFLFADSIRENIMAGNPSISDQRLEEIVAGCNLDRVVCRLPKGLDEVLSEGARTLSSGERQLIAFARALARDPEILVLDEATSSVDSETEKLIQEVTLRLMKGRTAIVVAHRLSTIRKADRIIVMHRGQVKETGTHESLMAEQGLYYQLYQWQANG